MGAQDNRELLSVVGEYVQVRVEDAEARSHFFLMNLAANEAKSIERVLSSRPFGSRAHQVWLRSLSTKGVDHSCSLRVSADGKRIEHELSVSAATYEKLHYLFKVFALDWELVPERPTGVEEYDA